MTKVIKLRKGLDIHLKGKAEKVKKKINIGKEVALCPDSFPGIQPKVVVKEGEHVKAGEILFVNKQFPSVGFLLLSVEMFLQLYEVKEERFYRLLLVWTKIRNTLILE